MNRTPIARWARSATRAAFLLLVAASPQYEPRWHKSLDVEKAMLNSPKGMVLTIAASQKPGVWSSHGHASHDLDSDPPTQWPGTGTYFVPPFADEVRATIDGPCTVGWCTPCKEPPGTFLRMTSTKGVDVWSREVESAPLEARVDANHEKAYFEVDIEASRRAFATASSTAFADFYFTYERPAGSQPPAQHLAISWALREYHFPTPTKAMPWTLKVTIYGVCPSAEPCAPPADEYVRIKQLVPRTTP
jgi:hypothetical protein